MHIEEKMILWSMHYVTNLLKILKQLTLNTFYHQKRVFLALWKRCFYQFWQLSQELLVFHLEEFLKQLSPNVKSEKVLRKGETVSANFLYYNSVGGFLVLWKRFFHQFWKFPENLSKFHHKEFQMQSTF